MSREELEKRILEARYNLVSSKDKETIDILEELAIKALEQEPIEVEATKLQMAYNQGFEDCRKAVMDLLSEAGKFSLLAMVADLPSVNPQEQNTEQFAKVEWWNAEYKGGGVMNQAIRDAIKAEEDKAYQKGFAEGLQMGGFDFDIELKLNKENYWTYVVHKALLYINLGNCEGVQYERGMLKVLTIMRETLEELRETDRRVKEMHTDKSCDTCKFEDRAIGEEPCKNCKHSYMDEWEAKR